VTVTGVSSNQALVTSAGIALAGSGSSRTVTITPLANEPAAALSASTTITLTVSDGPLSAQMSFLLTVTAINDPPTLGPIANPAAIVEDAGPQVVSLSGISAGGGESQALTVTALSSNPARIPNPSVTYTSPGATGSLSYTPVANAFGSTLITVRVTDALNAFVERTFTVTVNPAADTPSITGATTVVNTQTTSGLVVSRNAADGAEVTHVKIVSVSGGTLFQQDGTTAIAANAFITVAQAAAGLRFTPALNSIATGHVTVRASTSNADAGLGSAAVTADIAVGQTASTTTVATSLSPSNPGQPVTFIATVTPAAAAASGTVQFMDGAAPLGSPVAVSAGTASLVTPALTPGLHVITAAYSGNALAAPSTGTVTQTVRGGRAVLTGADEGGGPHVRRFAALDGGLPSTGALSSFFAFDPAFAGGVRVATGDVTGDGEADYIAGAGPGADPRINVFDGASGGLLGAIVAFEPAFHGGVFVAAGDVDGDGLADLIAGSGPGRRGEVRVFSGRDGSLLRDIFVFDPAFSGGVRVAAGDVNGDGRADLVVGSGAGMAAEVRVLNADTGATLRTLSPYGGFPGGVFVAAGDVTGDGFADIVTGAGAGGGPHVRVFDGLTGASVRSFFAFDPGFAGGVRVAAGDVNGDGQADVIVGSGPGRPAAVRVFDGATLGLLSETLPYGAYPAGLFVASAVPVNRMQVNPPAPGAAIHGAFTVAGWGFVDDPFSAGIAAIHVWAVPVGGAVPTFLGLATLGDARPDVAALFGGQYGHAGFHLNTVAPAPGVYDIAVFAQSARTGQFAIVRIVRVTVTP